MNVGRSLNKENVKLLKCLDQVQEYRKETDVLSNLLLEIMPLVKSQFNLEEYQSRDFRSPHPQKGLKNKENLLSKIKLIKSSKGFSTASSEEDLKLKLKLDNYELQVKTCKKTIDSLRKREISLLNKIKQFEKSEINLKAVVTKLENTVEEMERYNQTLKGKLTERIEIQGQKEEVQPALVSAFRFDQLLDDEEKGNFSLESSPEFDCESLMSTDENYIGAVTEKQNQLNHQKISSMCKKTRKLNNKSAIGPRNLELRQCDQSSTTLGYMQSSSSSLHKMLGNTEVSIPTQKSSIYRRKYRFMKEISEFPK